MKKFVTVMVLLATIFQARADEGMWLLQLLGKNYNDMKAQGFKLKPEDIYNLNKASLKDAIVQLGSGNRGFCTGEVVSSEGLLLTNHHCGYGMIQEHSTVDHDYLENGFWAMTKQDELPNPGYWVSFVVSIEDVTAQVTAQINGLSEADRNNKFSQIAKTMSDSATKGTHYLADVRSFFEGNTFLLTKYERFGDVRLVGAPPSSIGKFGHDTDNWMWPRHTGDFSMFRVYMGPDGKPAEYSPNNVPLKPKHHLPISLKGVKENDFSMILGFPGRTNRYLTSWGVQELLDVTNPNRVKIRGIRQDIWMTDMQASPAIKIQYASKHAGSSNYWKYSIGQNKGLKRLKVADKKRAIEKQFTDWVNADAARKQQYSDALPMLEKAYTDRKQIMSVSQYMSECLTSGIELFEFAYRFTGMAKKDVAGAKTYMDEFYKDYSMATDQKVALAMIELYMKDVDKKYYPDFYNTIASQYNNNYIDFTTNMYKKSIFADRARLEQYLAAPDTNLLVNDIAYKAAKSAFDMSKTMYAELDKFTPDIQKGRRLFMKGLMEMQPTKNFSPDANSTIRFTYGKVGDYSPADAVHYDYYTTLDGVMEKEDPNNWEFAVDAKLKDLYNRKDYGQYANADGRMIVCFTTNNDITGGNSGSPVMNGKGELIGIAFDGNWEAMSGDIAFETQLQKTICVDIRYVLFIVDKLGGASHLVKEMTIAK